MSIIKFIVRGAVSVKQNSRLFNTAYNTFVQITHAAQLRHKAVQFLGASTLGGGMTHVAWTCVIEI